MDLNVLPLPDDDDDTFEHHFEEYKASGKHMERVSHAEYVERAVDILRREREERRQRLKRERPDERPTNASQPARNDQMYQAKHHKPSDRNKLPPGWLDCPAAGHEIGCIIPSKVPLGETFNDSVLPGKRYSSRQVIHQQRVLGRKLGLVIDLTNTSRYYLVSDWKKEGIKHVKISCKGRDSVPDNNAVNQFVYEAIKIFAEARPPGIYKPDYIDALYTFYHERRPDVVVCPSTPDWKRSELDLNGDAMPDEDDDGGPASPLPVCGENRES